MAAKVNSTDLRNAMLLSMMIDAPLTPIIIKIVSAKEQKIAVENTWLLLSPCRKTNTFCAPITRINDKPKLSPLIKG